MSYYGNRYGLGQVEVDAEPVNGQMEPEDQVQAQVCPPVCPEGHPSLPESEPQQAGPGREMVGWLLSMFLGTVVGSVLSS